MDNKTADWTTNGGVSGAADTWPLSAREAAAAEGEYDQAIAHYGVFHSQGRPSCRRRPVLTPAA